MAVHKIKQTVIYNPEKKLWEVWSVNAVIASHKNIARLTGDYPQAKYSGSKYPPTNGTKG